MMGDNDSKIDARRIAVQEAKRKALELAGTYVESLTVVRNYQLTKEEIKAYTAGIVETEIIADEMRGTAQHPEIYIKTRCKIDTDTIAASIDRLPSKRRFEGAVDRVNQGKRGSQKGTRFPGQPACAEKNTAKAEETRKQLDERSDPGRNEPGHGKTAGPPVRNRLDDEEAVQTLTPEELTEGSHGPGAGHNDKSPESARPLSPGRCLPENGEVRYRGERAAGSHPAQSLNPVPHMKLGYSAQDCGAKTMRR